LQKGAYQPFERGKGRKGVLGPRESGDVLLVGGGPQLCCCALEASVCLIEKSQEGVRQGATFPVLVTGWP
jgi:hypothetical protein